MGHGKLKRFRENETFGCLLQPASSEVLDKSAEGFALRDHAIRATGTGRCSPATEHNLPNVAFLRTRIEFIGAFFAPGEVSEVWLTFSDPQMKSENSRLTSPRFLERYWAFMAPGGIVHLKTDSMFLHQYSKAMAEQNGLKILACTEDLYATDPETLAVDPEIYNRDRLASLYEVQTYYESMFLKQGLKITYLSFVIDREGPYVYPEFDADYWRSVEAPRKTFNVL